MTRRQRSQAARRAKFDALNDVAAELIRAMLADVRAALAVLAEGG